MGVPGLIGDVQPFAMLREGTITSVYKGYQRSLDRFVLLKVLKSAFGQDDDLVARFEAEAQLVARIQHPCVVAVYAYGHDDQQAYIATEFVDGSDLHELLAEVGALPAELAAYVILQAARGLRAAHERDVLHRDLKPSNLMVAHDGQVKLTDFGMASVAGGARHEGELRGTPGYMAPELITGEPPSVQTDLFALGATLYEMLTARRAFTGDTTDAVLDAVLHHDPLSVLDMHAEVPGRLRAVCARLLAKHPDDRYGQAEDVVLDLEVYRSEAGDRTGEAAMQAFLDDPDVYRSLTTPSGPTAHDDRNGHTREAPPPAAEREPVQEEEYEQTDRWRAVLAAFVAAVVLVAGTAFFLTQAERPERVRPQSSITLDDLFEEPAFPELDSLVPVARVQDGATEPDSLAAPTAAEAVPVTLSVTPWARVYVDGVSLGVTPLAQPLRLAPGRHTLVLYNPRFPSYRDSLVVTSGRADTVSVSLWDHAGRLFLEVSPWAVVSINGEVQDTIPPQDRAFVVPPGRNRLRLQHPQLGTWTTTIETRAGAVDTLQFNLQELLGQ